MPHATRNANRETRHPPARVPRQRDPVPRDVSGPATPRPGRQRARADTHQTAFQGGDAPSPGRSAARRPRRLRAKARHRPDRRSNEEERAATHRHHRPTPQARDAHYAGRRTPDTPARRPRRRHEHRPNLRARSRAHDEKRGTRTANGRAATTTTTACDAGGPSTSSRFETASDRSPRTNSATTDRRSRASDHTPTATADVPARHHRRADDSQPGGRTPNAPARRPKRCAQPQPKPARATTRSQRKRGT